MNLNIFLRSRWTKLRKQFQTDFNYPFANRLQVWQPALCVVLSASIWTPAANLSSLLNWAIVCQRLISKPCVHNSPGRCCKLQTYLNPLLPKTLDQNNPSQIVWRGESKVLLSILELASLNICMLYKIKQKWARCQDASWYVCEDAFNHARLPLSPSVDAKLKNTIAHEVAILCYDVTPINTSVSGVPFPSDKPWTPVSLILPINLATSNQLGLHPTWLVHPLFWRVSLNNLLIRVTRTSTSNPLPELKRGTGRTGKETDSAFMSANTMFGLKATAPPPPFLFHFIFLEMSGSPLVQSLYSSHRCSWRNYMGQVLSCDLFIWDWNQTSARSLSCDFTAHGSANSLTQRHTCSK